MGETRGVALPPRGRDTHAACIDRTLQGLQALLMCCGEVRAGDSALPLPPSHSPRANHSSRIGTSARSASAGLLTRHGCDRIRSIMYKLAPNLARLAWIWYSGCHAENVSQAQGLGRVHRRLRGVLCTCHCRWTMICCTESRARTFQVGTYRRGAWPAFCPGLRARAGVYVCCDHTYTAYLFGYRRVSKLGSVGRYVARVRNWPTPLVDSRADQSSTTRAQSTRPWEFYSSPRVVRSGDFLPLQPWLRW